MSEAEDSAEGTGRSLMALSLEAVVGKDVAHEVIIASNSAADKVVGGPEIEGWKRSGYVDSAIAHQRRRQRRPKAHTQFEKVMDHR